MGIANITNNILTDSGILVTSLPSGSGTTNEISYWVSASSIGSLTTATYPSLTELSYVKGVTSAIQTQFSGKQDTLTLTTTGTSGAATLVGSTLNIPQYSGGGSMAIGGSITSATAGSVLFAGTSGVLQQDNANFFWDDSNNRLGLGTSTPLTTLHVKTNISTQPRGITLEQYSNDGNSGYINFRKVRDASGALVNTDNIGSLSCDGWDGTQWVQTSRIRFQVDGTVATNSVPTSIQFLTGATGNGTERARFTSAGRLLLGTTTESTFLLDVNGTTRLSTTNCTGTLTSVTISTTNLTSTANASIGSISVGKGSGTGSQNTGVGGTALNANTTGSLNTAIGSNALRINTTGVNNTSVGADTMYKNVGGASNAAFGVYSLYENSSGGNNVAIGNSALEFNTTGGSNTAVGFAALKSNQTGSANVAIGIAAGRYITGGSSLNGISNNSIYIGYNVKANANNQTNQIVIGYDETGLGSNTTIIGNSSTTLTALRGSVVTGATSANASAQLQADSTTKGFLPPRMTNAQRIAITTPAVGLVAYSTDTTEGAFVNTSLGWQRIATLPVTTTTASTATLTPNVDAADTFTITAQAVALSVANPTGTPVNGQKMIIRIEDNGTARAITWSGTQYRASTDLALPTTTIATKTMYLGFIYNSTDTKWDLLAFLNNF